MDHPCHAPPSWLMDPLFDQFAAQLPVREVCDSGRPLRCHRRRISDRVVFDKLVQVTRFGCPYEGIADTICSATTSDNRCDEWVKLGIFAELKRIALDAVDRIVGLVLEESSADGCITKAPGGGEVAGPSPVDRRKGGMKRSLMVEGYGIPSDRARAGAHHHDSPLWSPSRPGSAGTSNEQTPGTTPSTDSSVATNATRSSSTRSSTSSTPSSPSATSSDEPGPPTAGTTDPNAHNQTPICATTK